MGIAGLAMAASVTFAVVLTDVSNVDDAAASTSVAIDSAKAQSRELENAILQFDPESRVIDGRTARLTADLENQIARLDRELQQMQVIEDLAREHEVLRLWRQRVGLLDALVDVHITRASNVGL
jgi:predicted secreted Zn-dependent protease